MTVQIAKLNSKIDSMEIEFGRNRMEMQRLIDENKCGSVRYDELLARNRAINDAIRVFLEQIWKFEK